MSSGQISTAFHYSMSVGQRMYSIHYLMETSLQPLKRTDVFSRSYRRTKEQRNGEQEKTEEGRKKKE
ncbi:hypothetical protein CHS0354_021497, partial [Potamilus streckersoni]